MQLEKLAKSRKVRIPRDRLKSLPSGVRLSFLIQANSVDEFRRQLRKTLPSIESKEVEGQPLAKPIFKVELTLDQLADVLEWKCVDVIEEDSEISIDGENL